MPQSTPDFPIHPLCKKIPKPSREEHAKLRDSIKAHGVRTPVVTYKGAILDGRTRQEICKELGLVMPTIPFAGGDPAAFVLDANVARRHLNPGQLAMIAADFEPLLAQEAKERQGRRTDLQPGGKPATKSGPTKAREAAAAITGASPRNVQTAKALKATRPDLAEKVSNDEMTINAADQTAKQGTANPNDEHGLLVTDAKRDYRRMMRDIEKIKLSRRELLIDLIARGDWAGGISDPATEIRRLQQAEQSLAKLRDRVKRHPEVVSARRHADRVATVKAG